MLILARPTAIVLIAKQTLGRLLMDMVDRTGHYAVLLSDLMTGPTYTFSGGGRNTRVDFCFIDCWAAHLVLECEVQQCHPV